MIRIGRRTPGTEAERHRKMGAELFNHVWTLLDKRRRTPEDVDEMIHAAHASRYHWSHAFGVKPVNLAIGEWQVSRVYAVLGRGEPALYHAQRSLAICKASGMGDFALAFAHEALARAYAVSGNARLRAEHLRRARAVGQTIAEKDDRALLFADLKTVPRARKR